MSPTPPNATVDQIVAALRAGRSVNQVARELRVDRARVRRIRNAHGIPAFVPVEQTRTLEEKWATYTRPLNGGHLEWTGERGAASGTPVLRYKDAYHSPASIAFRIRHGRDAEGYAIADCEVQHCIAPDHVEDEAGRKRNREQLRYLTGGQERKPFCAHGHDQAEHGSYGPNGVAYCRECKRLARQADREAVAV